MRLNDEACLCELASILIEAALICKSIFINEALLISEAASKVSSSHIRQPHCGSLNNVTLMTEPQFNCAV